MQIINTHSASKSIFRLGTVPKLLGRYADVSKGCGLLAPVNLKRKTISTIRTVNENVGRNTHFMTSVLLVFAQLYMGGVADENVYGN